MAYNMGYNGVAAAVKVNGLTGLVVTDGELNGTTNVTATVIDSSALATSPKADTNAYFGGAALSISGNFSADDVNALQALAEETTPSAEVTVYYVTADQNGKSVPTSVLTANNATIKIQSIGSQYIVDAQSGKPVTTVTFAVGAKVEDATFKQLQTDRVSYARLAAVNWIEIPAVV